MAKADVGPLAYTPLATGSAQPYRQDSRISPDGQTVVFGSRAALTGYDNIDQQTGAADSEVFIYRADANGGNGQLVCASCNPSGRRPTGQMVPLEGLSSEVNTAAGAIPAYATELYGSRVATDDGERVIFDSYEALVPQDTNGKEDVYEWEAPGSGTCTVESVAYSGANGGCISLISSGESPSNSEFVDQSANGRDVFFTTAASLVQQDPGLIDIYDAREGGGFPPPASPAASCEGEACQGPVSPPNEPTPASSSYDGPGNARPTKPTATCSKNAKRSGKQKSCTKKKKTKKKTQKKGQGKKSKRRQTGKVKGGKR